MKWDPVPGASAYLVDVATEHRPASATGDTASWRVTTSIPLVVAARHGWNSIKPYPDAMPVSYDGHGPRAQPALLRSCARPGRARHGQPGRLRRLHVPRRRHRLGVPVGRLSDRRRVHPVLQHRLPRRRRLPPSRPRHAHAPDAADHVEAARRQAELLRDRLARTRTSSTSPTTRSRRFPAYSPAQPDRPTTYSDETTLYYWAVLPATGLNGSGAVGDPLSAAASELPEAVDCRRRRCRPADGALLDRPSRSSGGRPSRERAATASRSRRSRRSPNPIEDVLDRRRPRTRRSRPIPADTTLYWRVRADDENLIGLTWSSVRTFQRRLPDADDRLPATRRSATSRRRGSGRT